MAADTLAAILTLALLALVILLLTGPFRPRRGAPEPDTPAAQELAALEAERESKYREIRDAELDFHTGKLSAGDHAVIDAALRSEAAEILKRLRGLQAKAGAPRELRARPGATRAERRSPDEDGDR